MRDILFVLIPCCLLMLVNGWTDAPVTVATAVSSGAVRFRRAVLLAAISNFAGGAAMCFFGNSVAVSIYEISGLKGSSDSLPALISAVVTVVLWSSLALKFGLPTSESHALLAALSGSAAAAANFSAVNLTEWLKVAVGLALTTYPLVILSYFVAKFFNNRVTLGDKTFKKLQVAGAMMSSFSHGAQDGQKFAGVLAVVLSLSRRASVNDSVPIPIWTVILSAGMITLGTVLGGRKIVNSIKSFAPENPAAGFSADLSSAIILSVLSVLGIPAATTVAKTMAIWGAGRLNPQRAEKTGAVRKMLAAWGLTFPVCFGFGYFLSKLLFFAVSDA